MWSKVHRVVVIAVSLVAACGGDARDDVAGDDRERRVVHALDAEGYYEATGDRDRRAVVRRFAGLCERLDGVDGAARDDELVAFLRGSASISSTGGWPRARVAAVAVPILCPRHRDVLHRAVATVS